MPDSVDDASLISRARGGESEAFKLLVERYFRAAYSSAYAVLGNSSDAEEMAQETFVQVYAKLELLREPGALASWVWRIARDCALKHLRKHKRMVRVAEVPEPGGRADGADAAMLAGEENEALRDALEKLPEEMRGALLMKFWEELDYDQMAARTGLSSAALYQRVCRGLKQLREIMESK
ncbi:MAG: sigma-70 family RNA polymerase sigma factor [Planctomycetes bacterium]|nr:sigma-70 family RNA polymerase sigma factor [Planctomycetota bacterium]